MIIAHLREPAFDGDYVARYDVPPDIEPGTYRLVVNGGQYRLATPAFEIVPSSGLQVRGVDTEHRGQGTSRLVFPAQNPAPDPERNLRSRPREPTGGRLEFEVEGHRHEARWDADADGWVANIGTVAAGDEIPITEHGVVDGLGNQSDAATIVTVGEVDDIEWPPAIGPGGGRSPGPGGDGTFPRSYSHRGLAHEETGYLTGIAISESAF